MSRNSGYRVKMLIPYMTMPPDLFMAVPSTVNGVDWGVIVYGLEAGDYHSLCHTYI